MNILKQLLGILIEQQREKLEVFLTYTGNI
jgi:hypothetical protein